MKWTRTIQLGFPWSLTDISQHLFNNIKYIVYSCFDVCLQCERLFYKQYKTCFVKAFIFAIPIRYLINYLFSPILFWAHFLLVKTLEVVVIQSLRHSNFPHERWVNDERTLNEQWANSKRTMSSRKAAFNLMYFLKKMVKHWNNMKTKNYHYDEWTVNVIYTQFIVDW